MSTQKSSPAISEKLMQLEELVAWFEGDQFTLEEALEKFKVAEKLSKDIETDLARFKNDITLLKKNFSKE